MQFRIFKDNFERVVKHSLFKNSIIYTFTDAINKAIPFLLLPVLTHYLSPQEFGIATNFSVYTSILLIFVGLSIQGAISVNYYTLNKQNLAEYISNTLVIIIVSFAVFLVVVYSLKEYIFNTIHLPIEYLIGGIVMALAQSLTSINLALWQLEEKALKYGAYEISQTAVNISLSLCFIIFFHLGWRGRINGVLYASIFYGFFSLYYIYVRGYVTFKINKYYIHDALIYSLPLLPHSLSMWVRSGIDRIYITKFLGEAQTGIYATGFQFGLLVSFITLAFNNAFVPYLFRNLNTKDPEKLEIIKIKLVKLTYLYMLILSLGGVFLIFFSYFIVNNFLSVEYIKVKSFIPWAIIAQIFQGMYLMFVNYIFFVKKTTKLAYVTFLCALVQIVLSFIFIKYFGAIGAAYSTVIVSFLNCLAIWIFSNKVYKMPWFKWGF